MVIKKNGEDTICYAFSYYYAELACARMLVELNQTMLPEGELLPAQEEAILKRVDQIQQQEGLMLDELQRKAVLESVRNSILILTGGPGTGKTTTINTIIRYFEGEGLDLCPRGADRKSGEADDGGNWLRGADNPPDA